MRRVVTASFLLVLLVAFATGCTTRVGDLTIATSKNLPQRFDVVRQDVLGKDCSYMFLFIPLGKLNPSVEGAIDDALEAVPEADAMADAQFHQDILFTLLFNQSCFRVKGDAIRTR
jgi:hypothetical protein